MKLNNKELESLVDEMDNLSIRSPHLHELVISDVTTKTDRFVWRILIASIGESVFLPIRSSVKNQIDS